jgi:colanic acid biosynthesis protein WcaH
MLSKQHWLEVVQRTPLVSIDLIVRDPQGRVLVGLRTNEPARDSWFVPGGVIRKNETLDRAFARITKVELGAAAVRSEARFIDVYEHHYKTNFAQQPGITTHYVILAHEFELSKLSDNAPLDQHQELRYLTVPELLAHPNVHNNTKAYFQ